jgi:NAD(P)H dehydrogenase (quinone)
MHVLVLYYSRSGNTKKLAEAIVQGVGEVEGVDCLLRSTAEVTREEFEESTGVIVGSPVYFGGMAAPLKDLLDRFVGSRKKMEDKVGAAFATAGDATGGKETTMLSILHALLIYGMIVVGDPLDATGHYGTACVGEPDEKTVENAKKLGKRVAKLTKMLTA